MYPKEVIIRLQLTNSNICKVKFNSIEPDFTDLESTKLTNVFWTKSYKNGHCATEVSYRIRQKGEHEMEQARQAYVTVQ